MSEQFGSSSPLFDQRMRDMVWPEFVCSGQRVPPYGVVEVKGFELKSGASGVRMTAQKPTESHEDRYPKWINSPVPVESGKPGRATRSGLIVARMKKPTTDGDLAFGDWFVADTQTAFTLKRTKVPPPGSCLTYLGGYQATEGNNIGIGVFEYRPTGIATVFGKLSGTLSAQSEGDGWKSAPKTATAKVLEYTHSSRALTERSETFTVVNRSNVEFAVNTYFGATRCEGEWHIQFVGC